MKAALAETNRSEEEINTLFNHWRTTVQEYESTNQRIDGLWQGHPVGATQLVLAERGELRKNLRAQIDRMIRDRRSDEFVRNFAGQWLQTRDVESVSIDARVVQAVGRQPDCINFLPSRREALMRRLEQVAQRLGRRLLTLDTRADDQAAALYRRLGWTETGRIPGFALDETGEARDTLFFWKQVG